MGWLVNSLLASMVMAFIVVKIYDYIFAGVTSSWSNGVRYGLFCFTWTAVTVQAGMSSVNKRARQLKQSIRSKFL